MTKVNDRVLQNKLRFYPHEGQKGILKSFISGEREMVLACGRRAGKSAICAYIALRAGLKPNTRIWIVSGSYELAQRVFNQLITFVAILFKNNKAYKIKMKPSPRLEFSNGSLCIVSPRQSLILCWERLWT